MEPQLSGAAPVDVLSYIYVAYLLGTAAVMGLVSWIFYDRYRLRQLLVAATPAQAQSGRPT